MVMGWWRARNARKIIAGLEQGNHFGNAKAFEPMPGEGALHFSKKYGGHDAMRMGLSGKKSLEVFIPVPRDIVTRMMKKGFLTKDGKAEFTKGAEKIILLNVYSHLSPFFREKLRERFPMTEP